MFQDFSSSSDPAIGAERTGRLQVVLGRTGLAAFLVPRSDEHLGEYVPPSSERLKWLTGFSGSAGLAVVGRQKAALCVDGRYTLQARQQVDTRVFDILGLPNEDLGPWLKRTLRSGEVIGFDPRIHSATFINWLDDAARKHGLKVRAVTRNPVDRLWGRERPPQPLGPVILQPPALAGRPATEKIAEARKSLADAGEDAAVLAMADSVCWLFNIRGSDVAHTPVVLAYAILHAKRKPELFVDPAKLGEATRRHLARLADLAPTEGIFVSLDRLRAEGARVRLHSALAPYAFWRRLGGKAGRLVDAPDPCTLPRARKNSVELEGARRAHHRDGAAVCRFLAWLDEAAPTGRVDEIAAVRRLEECRSETQALKEISFDTISGSGPNGAIVHYRVTEATNRRLRSGELFLVDSGGQYEDGTTDITRTVAIGAPTAEMRRHYTLVLKGHLAVAAARFPRGTPGASIDAFARAALWRNGLDFDHGTGHGVGSFLSVHEGPQGLSKRSLIPLEPGMIVSNEPGFYKEGAYGIRIENLEVVREPERLPGSDRETMTFETLTLVPYDRRLIDPRLLTDDELTAVDAYHARVRERIGPELGPVHRAWLEAATAPLRGT